MAQGLDQPARTSPPKNPRGVYMELRVLTVLFEELSRKAEELESSRSLLGNNEWVSLYKELYTALLVVEKGIYKRRVEIAVKGLQSIRGSIYTLFERYESLTKALQEAEQKTLLEPVSNEGTPPEAKAAYVTDIGKELEKTRERVRKLLESMDQRGTQR